MFLGNIKKCKIYDDYAHHPTEINASYEVAKHLADNKIIVILASNNQTELPIISRERQLLKIKKCLIHLKSFNVEKNIDMAADDIRSAIKEIEEIYHKFDIEQILDIIFNDFCIGK